MPLHPVPIIIGTTLAVIGGGYAFKKFVYDPHLAPFIEALLASHQSDTHRPIPVPVHSSSPTHASSTARRDRGSELRRRRTRSNEAQELQALLSSDGPSHLPVEYELRDKRSSDSFRRDQDAWGKTSSYELKEATKLGDLSEPADTPMDENAYRRTAKMKRKLSDPEVQLIQLDSPTVDREVLFSAMTPMASTDSSGPRPLSPLRPIPPSPLIFMPKSPPAADTALPSSPSTASPDARLAFSTISFDTAADQWANVRSPSTTRPDDDVLSLADTSMSGYEDAETYSPVSGARTPARLDLSEEVPPAPFSGLGLENVPTRRGPLSVVSLSESEGWAVDSDWATGSEADM